MVTDKVLEVYPHNLKQNAKVKKSYLILMSQSGLFMKFYFNILSDN